MLIICYNFFSSGLILLVGVIGLLIGLAASPTHATLTGHKVRERVTTRHKPQNYYKISHALDLFLLQVDDTFSLLQPSLNCKDLGLGPLLWASGTGQDWGFESTRCMGTQNASQVTINCSFDGSASLVLLQCHDHAKQL